VSTGLRNRTTLAILVLVALTAFWTDSRAAAQSAVPAIPDISGIWARKGPLDGKPNAQPVPRARAIGFSQAFDEELGPGYDCSPVTVPVILNDNYDFQISQHADRVVLLYEKDDVVRTVWLEDHGHPKPGAYDYTIQGHSTGRYEGAQLVIETTKFAFDPRGIRDNFVPSTTLKKVTERYWREGDLLKMRSVTEDPLVLREPFHYNFEWTRRTTELTPFNCEPEDARSGARYHRSKYKEDDLPANPGVK
jgi:hypothetical protein